LSPQLLIVCSAPAKVFVLVFLSVPARVEFFVVGAREPSRKGDERCMDIEQQMGNL
jgi:hypothetical protein